MPFSSRSPEMSTTVPLTGLSAREGKKSVPPARICQPEAASACTASTSVLGLRYREYPRKRSLEHSEGTQFLYKPARLYSDAAGNREQQLYKLVTRRCQTI